jgi:hypothetical protein
MRLLSEDGATADLREMTHGLADLAQPLAQIALTRPEIARNSRLANCLMQGRELKDMKNMIIRTIAGKEMNSRIWRVVLCGVAGLALSLPAAPKDAASAANAIGPVDFYVTVGAVREVPAGNPLPGLHFDAKVKGRMTDIYLAPMPFINRYEVKVTRGEEVRIVGTQVDAKEVDQVLAREITSGTFSKGVFHANMTIYLRNDEGPLW